MNFRYGITGRLLIWFLIVVSIFYGTLLVLYINVQQVVKLSEKIVGKNYIVSSNSKKMIESLLTMEESQKKYSLLQKEDYIIFYVTARKEFQESLDRILELDKKGFSLSDAWININHRLQAFPGIEKTDAYLISIEKDADAVNKLWIPDTVVNRWIGIISRARVENQKEVEQTAQQLNIKGKASAKNGLIGLAVCSLFGLAGVIYLAYTMIRPLRELIFGIRGLSNNGPGEPIVVDAKDEFGELADAFNEMTQRLRREERMRSDFISMLSHEIRTPLTAIRESVNMISEEVMGPINSRQRKFLTIAASEIDRISDLLNHLMQSSRLEPGVLRIEPSPIDPYFLISECVNSLKPSAKAKNIDIRIDASTEVQEISGDKEKLQQALLNLIGNAIKFSDSDTLIVVGVKRKEPDGDLAFFVKDNGPGILEQDKALLFNKYYRAKSARDHMDGVGLGLSIAKNIVEAHKGRVWVKSKIGKGSVFGFTLPAGEPSENEIV